MRVISGKYKRKKLISPPGAEVTRPTSDRVKESIFNILQNEIEIAEKHILDLFAGSGALGIESLSRGAKKAFFVERNKSAVECIKINLQSTATEKEYYEIFQNDVSDILNNKKYMLNTKIDLIFADPPYDSKWYFTALVEIENSNICNTGCLVVFEMPLHVEPISEISATVHITNWQCLHTRKYGKTKIEIWAYKGNKNEP